MRIRERSDGAAGILADAAGVIVTAPDMTHDSPECWGHAGVPTGGECAVTLRLDRRGIRAAGGVRGARLTPVGTDKAR